MALKEQKRLKVLVTLLLVLAVFLIGYLVWAISQGKLSFKASVISPSNKPGTIKSGTTGSLTTDQINKKIGNAISMALYPSVSDYSETNNKNLSDYKLTSLSDGEVRKKIIDYIQEFIGFSTTDPCKVVTGEIKLTQYSNDDPGANLNICVRGYLLIYETNEKTCTWHQPPISWNSPPKGKDAGDALGFIINLQTVAENPIDSITITNCGSFEGHEMWELVLPFPNLPNKPPDKCCDVQTSPSGQAPTPTLVPVD